MNRAITLTIPHRHGKQEVRLRIEQMVTDLHARFASKMADVEREWSQDRMDFVLVVMGQRVEGWLEVREESVYLELLLPWALAMFADAIRPQIEREARRRLEHK